MLSSSLSGIISSIELMNWRVIFDYSKIVFTLLLQGPIDNLADHVANPTAVTFATNGVSLPFVH